MKSKQLKWPKWTEQYEDIKEDNQTVRRVTRTDHAWDWIDRNTASVVSAARTLYRALWKVETSAHTPLKREANHYGK